ncbi:hypothetical protein BKA69DRAFT_1093820 [Paraphysoderma sedebokerense]|nr:hypothetical protein BKA69DRAFT_1093820 [Paraphysoderma sedebokerense]
MSILPKELVKTTAESVGIISLKDDVATAVTLDLEYRIRDILQESKKFMRHSKRTKLLPTDINLALKVRNVEPLYGYVSPGPFQFMKAGPDLFYVQDEELDFEKLLNEPLPKIPLETTFTGHWLAIDGVQPAIPQNPPPETKIDLTNPMTPPSATTPLSAASATSVKTTVKPLVKHVLSKELQLYYEKITSAVTGNESTLRQAALDSIRTDPGLQQLLPYFIQFVSQKVSKNMKDLGTLSVMLNFTENLLSNPHFFVEPYLHQLMPTLLSLVVGKRLSATPQEDHWSLRYSAATLITHLINQYSSSYSTLQPRVTKTLLIALLDPEKPFTTRYGAIVGLTLLGKQVVQALLVPNLKAVGRIIKEAMDDMESDDVTKMEAGKCWLSYLVCCRSFVVDIL